MGAKSLAPEGEGDHRRIVRPSVFAATISIINKILDESLEKFAKRPLEEVYPYLILDARYEKVREDGVIRSQAVQIATGINDEGRRQILAKELANRESRTSWRDMPLELKGRGLRGVEIVVSDDHPGLKRAIAEGKVSGSRRGGFSLTRMHFVPAG